jgi:hypothetical protein
MAIKDLLIELNNLKTSGVVEDYAIGGGYAAMLYHDGLVSYDVDVFVIVLKDEDYHGIYKYYRDQGVKIESVYIYIGDMPVQFLPNISELHNEAVKKAVLIEKDGIQGRFISIEYLIVMFLTVWRDKDRIRIRTLLKTANRELLDNLVQRFSVGEHELQTRYREILAGT